MSFSIKSNPSVIHTKIKNNEQEVNNDADHLQLRNGRYIYKPTKIPEEISENKDKEITNNNNNQHMKQMLIDNSIYEKEEIVYDRATKQWKIVKESELYKLS